MNPANTFIDGPYQVQSDKVTTTEDEILARYDYETTKVFCVNKSTIVQPKKESYEFKTVRKVPKLGLMLVGWGGNNGTTITGGILANQRKLSWHDKQGEHHADYLGSLTQASTVKIGVNSEGEAVYIPFKNMLPMVSPNDIVIGGWDISGMNLADAMQRAQVLDYDLQKQLKPLMQGMQPLPSIFNPAFIAANQDTRADNVIARSQADIDAGVGQMQFEVDTIRSDIKKFKTQNSLDKVIVLWTANTERFCVLDLSVHGSADSLLAGIKRDAAEISPSTLFAVASLLEGCSFINGSPQNSIVPGVVELAKRCGVFVAGDDFKSGQTKMKSVLVDYLVSAGIKPVSIVSYNHLGNNDGKNLSAPEQFRSKEISKSNVVDDMVLSNRLLYQKQGETPDHCVVIKYVPYVADSKRAMDEYTSEIFLGGKNTIVMHNTCEDSLLAAPIILDLVILCEICERIEVRKVAPAVQNGTTGASGVGQFERFDTVLSLLSYLLKAPMVPEGAPIVNALSAQRQCIVNIFRACVGLPPENNMHLEHRIPAELRQLNKAKNKNKNKNEGTSTAGKRKFSSAIASASDVPLNASVSACAASSFSSSSSSSSSPSPAPAPSPPTIRDVDRV